MATKRRARTTRCNLGEVQQGLGIIRERLLEPWREFVESVDDQDHGYPCTGSSRY
jgi:hypothetical protein